MKYFLVLGSLFTPFVVFAEEASKEGLWLADPWWFPLPEIGGVLVCALALLVIHKTLKTLGGTFGESIRLIQYGVVLILGSFVFRAFIEIRELEGFVYDVLFELPLYATVLFIALATKRLGNVFVNK